MLLSYGSGQQRINNNNKCRQIAGKFDCHVDAAALLGVHCPLEHIQGFTGSHWMLQSGKCLKLHCPGCRHGRQIC